MTPIMPSYEQGRYRPINPSKYVGDVKDVVYRSSWELKFMRWCDRSPSVTVWTSEYPIKYYSQVDEKVRRYFVDFFVKVQSKDGSEKVLMVEVKPEEQTKPPRRPRINNPKTMKRYLTECETFQVNQDKWTYAEKFAADNGMLFIILNEYDLGIKKRAKK